jgi:branched-chain amino acid aminotransferase
MYKFLPTAFFQGEFVPFENATVSVATHALHYGTGAFGGLRGVPNPKNPNEIILFRLDKHAKRLSDSAKFLLYDIPPQKIFDTIVAFIKVNKPQIPFYIRPLVYTTDLGISPRIHNVGKDFFVYGLELGDYLPPGGVSCRISSWTRQEDRSFPLRGKIAGAYITSSLAKSEAHESGFDEAILMNSQGKVSEATGMNIFIARNGQLITPGNDQDILEGITRESVIKIARDMSIPVIERPIDKSELFIADEVFFTGTAAKVTPVKKIENYALPEEKPLASKLRKALTSITEGNDPKYADWVYRIAI